ncbi:MAG TPA: hypothetical protein VKY74_26275 [Chloroflexia bacterium]|nr:hypothetical protein [Chloroflexia bacterium]
MLANRNVRLGLGVGVLLLAIGIIGVAQVLPKPAPPATPTPPPTVTTVTCIGGSEKQPLLDDPEIAALLRSRYALNVQFSARGSLDLVQIPTAELKQKGINCLWPSNASAQLIFEKVHSLADFPGYRAENVLNSPLVIYSWKDPTEALLKQGIVEQRQGQYYISKLRDLLTLVKQGGTWQSIGSAALQGPVRIKSTNPTESNSGNILYLLMLNTLASSSGVDVATLASAQPVLPQLKQIYDAQGLQSRSSGFGFEAYLTQGVGAFPLYAGYESQILEASVQNPQGIKAGGADIRILYPDPTAWSSHPILALDAGAQKLITAMKDADVQQLAWRKHGFRSAVFGTANAPADFPLIAVPGQITHVVDLPGADVILKMNECLTNGNCS